MASAVNICLLFLAILLPSMHPTEAQIGVCYGFYAGENLPSTQEVIKLYKSYGIGTMRIYDLNEEIIKDVYHAGGIDLVMAVPNIEDYIHRVGSNPMEAHDLVNKYVVPYASCIKYIVVGNEVHTESPSQAQWVGPAMQNIQNALNATGLGGSIKVTTAIETSLVINSYPPSSGEFSDVEFMRGVANFLVSNGSPLLVNVYTFYANDVDLSYKLLNGTTPRHDPMSGKDYYSLFDAIVDATYWATKKVTTVSETLGMDNGVIKIVASETGKQSGPFPSSMGAYYPNDNGDDTTGIAQEYYQNVINHAKQGTPMNPGPMEIYLFEMFDEVKAGDKAHYGIYNPDGTPKFQLHF